MSEPMQALTLVTCENDKIILNEDVLTSILESEEARNKSVVIISIAGIQRKGKSFFLNFILRYLKSKCDRNWIWSGTNKLEGFEWKPNRDGVTSGITIWPQVFVVNNNAVLLIDTQGLFDIGKNEVEDTYIMVLSTLFSSIQILNHQEDINSSDLKNFEFFAKYGIALERKISNLRGFQNLMFLIRDWKYQSSHSYGLKSGYEHLDGFLKTQLNGQLQYVRDTLMHFENVEFFLMPHPGKDVDRNEEFGGEIDKIELIFLDHMKNLVEHLIANVKPKKLLGREVNGESLVPVLKQYVEYLNKGLLPVPKSLIKLQMELSQNEAEKECMKVYNDNMREKTREQNLNKAKMKNLHDECVARAIAAFDTLPDFGNRNQIETMKVEFSMMIEATEFLHYKTTMEEKVESKLMEIFNLAKINYNISLSQHVQISNTVQDLRNGETNCRRTTINNFNSVTEFGDAERIQELLEELEQHMDEENIRSETIFQENHSRATLSLLASAAKSTGWLIAAAATMFLAGVLVPAEAALVVAGAAGAVQLGAGTVAVVSMINTGNKIKKLASKLRDFFS